MHGLIVLHQCFVFFQPKKSCKRCSPVIIDKTNMQAWEMKPYVKLVSFYPVILSVLQNPLFSYQKSTHFMYIFINMLNTYFSQCRAWREDTVSTLMSLTPVVNLIP